MKVRMITKGNTDKTPRAQHCSADGCDNTTTAVGLATDWWSLMRGLDNETLLGWGTFCSTACLRRTIDKL